LNKEKLSLEEEKKEASEKINQKLKEYIAAQMKHKSESSELTKQLERAQN